MEPSKIIEVFLDVEAHRLTADIIRRHSTNRKDIRELALEGLDLRHCRAILDLGCGFGFFTEALRGRVHPDACVKGVDIIEDYGPLYLGACRRAGLRGAFFHPDAGVHIIREYDARSFDLVLCSYALYFFPEIIPDISRVLRPEGLFISITHSPENMGELIGAARDALRTKQMLSENTLPIERVIRRFSTENGRELLSPWFESIRAVDYPNTLVFSSADLQDLVGYFRFKSPFFLSGTGFPPAVVSELLRQHLEGLLRPGQPFRISKDDTVFIAAKPRQKEARS